MMRSYWRYFVLTMVFPAMTLLCSCQMLGQGEVKQNDTFVPPDIGRYLDFEDVRIPSGMYLDREGSFVYESDTIKAGMLNIYGRSKMADALRFFENNMEKDGWKMLSNFKYQKSILLFTKPGKVCTIVAYPSSHLKNMSMEVWVAPIRDGDRAAPTVVVPGSHTAGLFGRAGKVPIGVTDLGSSEAPLPNTSEPLPQGEGLVARAKQKMGSVVRSITGNKEPSSGSAAHRANTYEQLPRSGNVPANTREALPSSRN